MNLTPPQIVAIAFGAAAYFGILYFVDRALFGRSQLQFRYGMAAATLIAFFLGLRHFVDNQEIKSNIVKGGIAAIASMAVLYETARAGAKQPIAERWKRIVGITLGVGAIVCYFNGFQFGYPKYFHRWDQFHYYMGAKYFREMGYDGLYKCAAIAQDEIGTVDYINPDDGKPTHLDMSKEVHHGDKKIRNLGGNNLLIPVADILAHPEVCKASFTGERWSAFKADVRFFRTYSDKQYWEDMQKDHGYNPPPVWTILGHAFAELAPASERYLQFLAMLDIVYLAGTFGMLYWAFGWRVFAVAAIFWGTQASAPFFWTGGAFLRQDWLFYLVAACCLARKRHYRSAGAAMVYAGLLRVFPGLTVIGWLVVLGWTLVRKHGMTKPQQRMLLGGVLAAAVLIPTSLAVSGKDSYQSFFKHTLEVHDMTPLTNHMGLRVLISHNVGTGVASGRMAYTRDEKLADPFEVWKRMRNERYAKYKWIGYGFTAICFAFFAYALRRVRSMWVAQCLAQVFIILMSQLTSYYYAFMILSAPLTKVRRDIEGPLFGLALVTQLVWSIFQWNDDRYTVLTALSLIFCLGLVCAITKKDLLQRFGIGRGATQEGATTT